MTPGVPARSRPADDEINPPTLAWRIERPVGVGLDGDRRTARWVGALVVGTIVLQRFAVPGLPVSILLPLLLGWLALGLLHGVLRLDAFRSLLFAAAVGVSGLAVLLQPVADGGRSLSVGSWALVIASLVPFVVVLADRRVETFVRTLGVVIRAGMGLAGLTLAMTATQLVGLRYVDLIAAIVPHSLLLDGFAITYPYSYGSPYFRANAWIGLEPSFVSLQLGIALVAALLLRRSWKVVAFLAAAMVSTASGSGFVVVVVAVLVVAVGRHGYTLAKFAVPTAILVAAGAVTPFGLNLLLRVVEIFDTNSSASLRAVQPYTTLWPDWTGDIVTMSFGAGAGSSQGVVDDTGIAGLLVPTPAKLLFDYGILGGVALVAYLVVAYRGAPARPLTVGIFVDLWFLQPGPTTTVLIVPVVACVSLWTSRPRTPFDVFLGAGALAQPAVGAGGGRMGGEAIPEPRRPRARDEHRAVPTALRSRIEPLGTKRRVGRPRPDTSGAGGAGPA